MISLLLEDFSYEQDIRELCMAFYPGARYIYVDGEEVIFTLKAIKQESGYKLKLLYPDISYEFNIDEGFDRYKTKNLLKKALYDILSGHTGIELPWGTLTGIRPTKIVSKFLEEGKDRAYISDELKRSYLVSDKKIDLSIDVALKEKDILDKIGFKDYYSLYIGIPYCPSICSYCSFSAYPIKSWQHTKKAYIESLCRELKAVAAFNRHRKLQTVYMGGGTPTSLEAAELEEIIYCVREHFPMDNLLEFCVEAGRPDSIDEDKLNVMKKLGISRISINPQSMNQSTLDKIGRSHTVQMIVDKFYMARELGFDNINMDIILGLPDEGLKEIEYTMQELSKLNPESITIHSLAIKRAARLNNPELRYMHDKALDMIKMFDTALEYCKTMDMQPYYLYRQKNIAGNLENLGLAKNTRECIYNILIMEEKQDIIACGAGASSKIVSKKEGLIERIENVKEPAVYIERIDELIKKKDIFT